MHSIYLLFSNSENTLSGSFSFSAKVALCGETSSGRATALIDCHFWNTFLHVHDTLNKYGDFTNLYFTFSLEIRRKFTGTYLQK